VTHLGDAEHLLDDAVTHLGNAEHVLDDAVTHLSTAEHLLSIAVTNLSTAEHLLSNAATHLCQVEVKTKIGINKVFLYLSECFWTKMLLLFDLLFIFGGEK